MIEVLVVKRRFRLWSLCIKRVHWLPLHPSLHYFLLLIEVPYHPSDLYWVLLWLLHFIIDVSDVSTVELPPLFRRILQDYRQLLRLLAPHGKLELLKCSRLFQVLLNLIDLLWLRLVYIDFDIDWYIFISSWRLREIHKRAPHCVVFAGISRYSLRALFRLAYIDVILVFV